MTKECREKEKKESRMIIFDLKESAAVSDEAKKDEDLKIVKSIINDIGLVDY